MGIYIKWGQSSSKNPNSPSPKAGRFSSASKRWNMLAFKMDIA